jgi:hypothetical protein
VETAVGNGNGRSELESQSAPHDFTQKKQRMLRNQDYKEAGISHSKPGPKA